MRALSEYYCFHCLRMIKIILCYYNIATFFYDIIDEKYQFYYACENLSRVIFLVKII